MKSLAASIFVSFLFLACSSAKKNASDSTTEKTISTLDGKYLVTQLNGENVSEHNITMEFDKKNKKVSGYSGCNTYSSTYTVSDNGVVIDIPMATKRYCPDLGDLEKDFFKALTSCKTTQLKSDQLLLNGMEGKTLLAGVKE
ncbi:META domain-containing protein [Aquimarina brevivitae]|uniref:Heat shock protein HslJ n=1 Tax=Aquimarina brevivitae TaxID=323412 RepID=A0A4Q7PIP3_9FLAO|nr:META domain-containing protein [Aquimarina brevivitae]RZS99868.1 heat shock protein HslJ [Aquimarina brevivitae]